MFYDLRFAIRSLVRSPRYAAAVILIFALSIGANAAVFTAVYGVLLKPWPIREPQNLVIVWDSDRARNLRVVELSYRTVEYWTTNSRSFAAVAAIGSSGWPAILQGRGAPVRVTTTGVSASFFNVLGVRPLLGRMLLPEDDVPNAPSVAILGHAAWVTYFGADSGVIGSRVRLDTTRTIVGVMPPEFDFPRGTSFWFPVVPLLSGISRSDFDALKSVGVLFAVGRLQPGVTPAAAAQELDRLARTADGATPAQRFGSAVVVTSFLDYVFGQVRQGLWALWAGVGLLLLIACANVSGLMLTRASIRSREHAIRAALGATRIQVARLWLCEATVLASAGGLVGLACAWWMTRAMIALAPTDLPRMANTRMTPAVALFGIALVLITAMLCGIVPARDAGERNPVEGLNDAAHGSAGRQRQRARSMLLAMQMALSVVLLISAGLVVRSFTALRTLDLGFVSSDVLTMFVGPESNEGVRQLLGRIETLRDVEAAGAVYLRPLELGPVGQETSAQLEGQTEAAARANPTLNFQVTTPNYFRAMRIRLLRGRPFSDLDRGSTAPVAIVSEATARRLWPGEDAVGKRILLNEQRQWRTIVGVVADVHYRGLGDVRLDVYEPAAQSSSTPNYIVIRTSRDPLSIVSAVQAEIRRFDPGAVVDSISTLDAIVARATAPWRFTSWLLAALATVAFVMTTAGLFSVVSLQVANRRYELAIRSALGAERAELLRCVLVAVGTPAIAGLVVGIVAAGTLTGVVRGFLFRVGAFDPITWSAVLTMLVGVAGIAAFIPARDAASVDPVILMRR